MSEPHTHGGTDAPECTTCTSIMSDPIAELEALCDEWDRLSKGSTVTTRRIRDIIARAKSKQTKRRTSTCGCALCCSGVPKDKRGEFHRKSCQ